MIFTCSKDIEFKNIKFNDGCLFVGQEKEYKRIKKILSKFNYKIPIRGNDGIVVNKKKKTFKEA